jgi:hypothetical protein
VRDFVLDSFENKTGVFKNTKYKIIEGVEGESEEEVIDEDDP